MNASLLSGWSLVRSAIVEFIFVRDSGAKNVLCLPERRQVVRKSHFVSSLKKKFILTNNGSQVSVKDKNCWANSQIPPQVTGNGLRYLLRNALPSFYRLRTNQKGGTSFLTVYLWERPVKLGGIDESSQYRNFQAVSFSSRIHCTMCLRGPLQTAVTFFRPSNTDSAVMRKWRVTARQWFTSKSVPVICRAIMD